MFQKEDLCDLDPSQKQNPHQIDHFLVNGEMFPRILNAGATKQLIDSDHSAIIVTIRVMKRLKRNIDNRKKLLNLDYSLLSQTEGKEWFNAEVVCFTSKNDNLNYSNLANALQCASETVLPRKTRAQPD